MEKKKNNTELDLDEDGIPKLEYIQVGEFLLPNLSLEKVDGYRKMGNHEKRVPTKTQTSCLFFDAFDG